MSPYDFLCRLLVAIACGLAIGLERQFSRQMAGIRTNALICIGACIYTMVPFSMNGGDPLRVAAQIVTGIGFLGGGVIVRDGFTIKGLTTAATMWCTAAVGMMAGGGFLWQAGVVVACIVGVNLVLHPLSKHLRNMRMPKGPEFRQYQLFIDCRKEQEESLRVQLCSLCVGSQLQFSGFDVLSYTPEGTVRMRFLLDSSRSEDTQVQNLMSLALALPGVTSASWHVDEESGE